MERTENEKQKIRNWVDSTNNYSFQGFNELSDSYFSIPDEDDRTVTYAYKFQTIKELECLMKNRKKIVCNETIDRICSIAAFKGRRRSAPLDDRDTKNDKCEKLPEYIYNM